MRMSDNTTAKGPDAASRLRPASPPVSVSMENPLRRSLFRPSSTFGSSSTRSIFSFIFVHKSYWRCARGSGALWRLDAVVRTVADKLHQRIVQPIAVLTSSVLAAINRHSRLHREFLPHTIAAQMWSPTDITDLIGLVEQNFNPIFVNLILPTSVLSFGPPCVANASSISPFLYSSNLCRTKKYSNASSLARVIETAKRNMYVL